MPALIPVLLAGGSGTRLWPLSRESFPKQFHALTGEQTLIQQTALRAAALADAVAPIVICNESHRFLVAEQLRQIGIADFTIVLEPVGRNTAPAAAVASLIAEQQHGPDAMVFIMAADHVIRDEAALALAVAAASATAQSGRIVTFGITPSRAETGYGYIARGEDLRNGAHTVEAFVEKPDAARAKAFVDGGRHFWNGGMFVFKPAVFIDELNRLAPAIVDGAKLALSRAKSDLDFVRLDKAAFESLPSDSIDYAVMEKTELAAMVTLDAGWDDVGSWSFLETQTSDASGNYGRGDVVFENCRNTLVHSEGRLVAAVGIENTVVVATKDAVLVAHRDHVQDVKKIVGSLKIRKRSETVEHSTVHRPWGSYEGIGSGRRFQVKHIVVKPGQKLSLQMHHHRAEHWIVVSGTAKVTCDGKEFLLTENQSTFIPLGSTHRLENPGSIPLDLIEVQSGSYLGEDDIVRFDDVYGRLPAK